MAEVQEAETKTNRHLTDQSVGEALKADVGPEAHLVSWQVNDFTKKGDNYACIVTSVVVQYTLEGAHQEKTYVAKMNRNFSLTSMDDMMNPVFVREGTCFLEIVPRMNKLLEEIGFPVIGTAKIHSCSYEKGKEVLLLEDLRARNFKMYDRRRGMDAPHAKLVLKELGKLHAASLLLERTLPTHDITKTWEVFTDAWKTDENARRLFESIICSQLEGAATIMEKVPNYEFVVKWIRKNKEHAVDIFLEYYSNTFQHMVLVHGDCWNNNLLFRYNDAGDPIEVMLIDLQVMRKTTPVVDLNYFLYSSFNGPVRKLNFEEFLKTYHTSFSSVLKAGEAPVPFTLEELHKEFRQHKIFGCLSGMVLLPIVLSEAADVMDFDEMTDDNIEEINKERLKKVVNMSQKEDDLLKPRFLDMFDDMIEAGVIS
ncbi:uncharacterized protein [Panulirus ornatus]|uniref:uncharacterized protein n=1 Tax=Panulirus ornatus TaxID=150431 RepID=UPI003A8B9099